jgi:hypothetical protein
MKYRFAKSCVVALLVALGTAAQGAESFITVASTTSTQNSGLFGTRGSSRYRPGDTQRPQRGR